MNVNYFSLTYKQLDRLVTEDVRPAVERLCDSLRTMDVTKDMSDHDLTMGTSMFELYMALQEFFRFKCYLTPSEQGRLCVLTYPDWFAEAVTKWLLIARYKAMVRIQKSIELDKTVTQVDSLVKHSTSAVDTASCFYQIKIFWKQLAWPDLVSSYVFITKILDDICNGAMYFADLTYKRLCESGFYDEEGQFDCTEQLCITINNIEHVRATLRPLPEELDFEAVLQAVEKAQGEPAAKACRVAMYSILHSAIDDVENQIVRVVKHVGEKMRPDLKKTMFHLTWAPDALPTDEAIIPLMDYLDSNLMTLNSNLLNINFDRILYAIWNVVLEELLEQAKSGVGEKQIVFFERLHSALKFLLDFFHADDKGLTMECLHSEPYKRCQRFLDLYRMDTDELIIKYYLEKLEDQQKVSSTSFGTLTVRVYFHHESLCIEVLSAKDILALDTNGYSDPFVILELLPPHIFANCPVQRTRVQKKTLQPVFDEIFEYPASLDQCKHEAAMIQFTVMDHDLVLSNDFAGEAFLSLNQIPGVTEKMEDISTLHGLKPVELILMRPKQSDNEILNALDKRHWDKSAMDFVKCRKVHSA